MSGRLTTALYRLYHHCPVSPSPLTAVALYHHRPVPPPPCIAIALDRRRHRTPSHSSAQAWNRWCSFLQKNAAAEAARAERLRVIRGLLTRFFKRFENRQIAMGWEGWAFQVRAEKAR